MKPEPKACPYQFSVEETEAGYAIHVKGDKEKLKARLEALEAYQNFRQKAQKAGFYQHSSHNRNHGFLSLLHKHMQAFHPGSHPCRESEKAD